MILERLDRIVANYAWLNLYPEAYVHHLPRTHFDHCPLLLSLDKNLRKKSTIFRFKTMWLSHHEFSNLVNQIWHNDPPILQAIIDFTSLIKTWNYQSF